MGDDEDHEYQLQELEQQVDGVTHYVLLHALQQFVHLQKTDHPQQTNVLHHSNNFEQLSGLLSSHDIGSGMEEVHERVRDAADQIRKEPGLHIMKSNYLTFKNDHTLVIVA